MMSKESRVLPKSSSFHSAIYGRKRTKDPVTVHAVIYSDAVITDVVDNFGSY
jgi:hypothetical protein